MESSIKILHTEEKLTKDGRTYRLVHALIKIGSSEFVRKFYVFPKA